MKAQSENEPYDEINITPMLDLAYVLLVIFIIMTTATVQGIVVNLPKASAAPSLAKPQTKAITLTADGTIYLDTIRLRSTSWKPRSASTRRPIPPCRWWSRQTPAFSTNESWMCSICSVVWRSASSVWSPSGS
jgi:Biopolymer transport protein ExbD/TolR